MGSHRSDRDEDSERRHEHKGNHSHELLAGAAAFAAVRAFESYQKSQGKTVSHSLTKELLATVAAAGVEKLIETKGREKWDEYRSRSRSTSRDEGREKTRDMLREGYEGPVDGYVEEVEVREKRHRHREIEEPRRSSHSRDRRRRKEEAEYYY